MFFPPPQSPDPPPSPEEILRRAREVVEQNKVDVGNPGYQAPIVQKKCDCGAEKAKTGHAFWCSTLT